MDEDLPEAVHYGYTTADRYYWVCEPCFRDFRARFGWTVE